MDSIRVSDTAPRTSYAFLRRANGQLRPTFRRVVMQNAEYSFARAVAWMEAP